MYLQCVLQDPLTQVLEHVVLRTDERFANILSQIPTLYIHTVLCEDDSVLLVVMNCLPALPRRLGADLVCVSSPGLFRHVQAAAVSSEATVGPVGIVETK